MLECHILCFKLKNKYISKVIFMNIKIIMNKCFTIHLKVFCIRCVEYVFQKWVILHYTFEHT